MEHGNIDGLDYLILKPTSDYPYSLIKIYINTGSLLDKKNGLSHIIEHLHFQYNRIFEKVYEINGIINAYTTPDEVCYHLHVPHHNVYKAIKLLTSIISKFSPTDEKILKENRMTLDEQHRRQNNDSNVIYRKAMSIMYKGHLLADPEMEIPEKVPSFTLDEIKTHVEKIYVKQNMLIVVQTEKPFKKILEYINIYTKKFRNISSIIPTIEPYMLQEPHNSPVISIFKHPVSSNSLILFGFPQNYEKPSFKIFVLREFVFYILAKSKRSELMSSLRVKKNLVYGISGYTETISNNSCNFIYTSCNKKVRTKVINSVYEVIDNIKNGKFIIPFEIHRNNFIVSKKLENSINNIYLDIVITQYRSSKELITVNQIEYVLNSITFQETIAEANRVLNPKHSYITILDKSGT